MNRFSPLTRRRFATLSAAALAATRIPGSAQQTSTAQPYGFAGKPVGYAAIGLGTISDIFMRACVNSQQAKITALVTGHADTKGKKYAAMYNIPESSIYTYETFDQIRNNPAVDAVYIGLPNSMHAEYTLRAARAGKHVLCEKPMAISSAECRRMIDACKQANVRLMIAYRCHFDPSHLAAKQAIDAGEIGRLLAFEGAFGFNAHPGQWRLERSLAGGGSLMDVGIYPLNAIRFFTGEEPVAYTAVATTNDKTSGRFSTMEENINFTLRMPSGASASVASTYGAPMPGFLRVHGDKATLELSPGFDYTGIHLRSLASRDLHIDTTSPDVQTAHFTLEADHFAHCVRTGETPRTPGEEGLKDLVAMEAIYQAAGTPIA